MEPAYYHEASSVEQRRITDLAIAAGNLALAYDELADFNRSARLYERVLVIDERTVGPDDLARRPT